MDVGLGVSKASGMPKHFGERFRGVIQDVAAKAEGDMTIPPEESLESSKASLQEVLMKKEVYRI